MGRIHSEWTNFGKKYFNIATYFVLSFASSKMKEYNYRKSVVQAGQKTKNN
jgi:hypothetical protein